jgi:hypothetical protein
MKNRLMIAPHPGGGLFQLAPEFVPPVGRKGIGANRQDFGLKSRLDEVFNQPGRERSGMRPGKATNQKLTEKVRPHKNVK